MEQMSHVYRSRVTMGIVQTTHVHTGIIIHHTMNVNIVYTLENNTTTKIVVPGIVFPCHLDRWKFTIVFIQMIPVRNKYISHHRGKSVIIYGMNGAHVQESVMVSL